MSRPPPKFTTHNHRGYPVVIIYCHRDAIAPYMHAKDWLCGYVGVPHDHPWSGKGYDAVVATPPGLPNGDDWKPENAQIRQLLRAHGGVNFGDRMRAEIDPEDRWYFGFDCNHYGDEEYPKSEAYVLAECRMLADDLITAAEATP